MTTRDRQWWFDARGLGPQDMGALNAAYQSSCSALLLSRSQVGSVITGKQKVVYISRPDDLEGLPDDFWVLAADEDIVARARTAGRKSGPFVEVRDLESEFAGCLEACKRGSDFVVIDIHHAT